ncbi:MAG: 2-amino-4-hydroxy-6-hydroxymethyldihydropteridine diphosphokinase [Thermoanaerobaculia bacterium]
MGSNIEPRKHLRLAVEQLERWFPLRGVSRVYESAPVGPPGSPRFLNAAVWIETSLPPARLKYEHLRPLEVRLGRLRGSDRNAPRTIDLDIALFGALVLEDRRSGLVIPAPEILTRAYVALPLADVAPEMRHPVTGESLAAIAARFGDAPETRATERVPLGPRKRSSPQ